MDRYITFTERLSDENKKTMKLLEKLEDKIGLITNLYPRLFDIPSKYKVPTGPIRKLSSNELKIAYYEKIPNRAFVREIKRTNAEIKVLQCIRELARTKRQILPSIWIGSRNIDLFIPNIGGTAKNNKKMRGLAIEVDGDSHKYELKMKKDECKGQQLAFLGIGLTHINNWDLNEKTAKYLFGGMKSISTLDSRERKRMWKRIYLFTLCSQLPYDDFIEIFRD